MLGRRSAQERLAIFLHQLSERYRALGRSGESFLLPMSREDIARFLGLALETVSRGFSRLQDDGIITEATRLAMASAHTATSTAPQMAIYAIPLAAVFLARIHLVELGRGRRLEAGRGRLGPVAVCL